ncbi:MAG: response regulator [Candidatus Aminicenantes bacterium]|nr:response regulator [Candidatus Aminicenantes bacterium]
MDIQEGPILLVEDDQVDAMTVKRAFKDVHITNDLVIVGNGLEALDYLQKPDNRKPCIILLDLNMPKMNGIEFLKVTKKDPELKMIPIVVLTTSEEEQDRVDSYGLGVAGYILKPVDYRKFVEVINTIDLYWTLCILPPKKE